MESVSSESASRDTDHNSVQHNGKVSEFVQFNDALSLEVAELKSGKDRWLAKLRLLEDMLLSNLVQIGNWAIDNQSWHADIKSEMMDCAELSAAQHAFNEVEDGVCNAVDDYVSLEQPAWRLSVADVLSVFRESSTSTSSDLSIDSTFSSLLEVISSETELKPDAAQGIHCITTESAIPRNEEIATWNEAELIVEKEGNLETALGESIQILEREKGVLEIELLAAKEYPLTLDRQKGALQIALDESSQTLQEVRQHARGLQREKLALEKEFGASRLTLEREKGALVTALNDCTQHLEKIRQHKLTLEKALQGAVERADVLDCQLELSRNEIERLREVNQKLQSRISGQEDRVRALETHRDELQEGFISLIGMMDKVEDSLVQVNESYAGQTKPAHELEHHEAYHVLKLLLENATQRFGRLKADHGELQNRLKKVQFQLQGAEQEACSVRAEYESKIAALKEQRDVNVILVHHLVEQLQRTSLEMERATERQDEEEQLKVKLKDMEQQLDGALRELELGRAEQKVNLTELQKERLKKGAALQQLEMEKEKSRELGKELDKVITEQAGTGMTLEQEGVKYKLVMEELQEEKARSKELVELLELVRAEQEHVLAKWKEEKQMNESLMTVLELEHAQRKKTWELLRTEKEAIGGLDMEQAKSEPDDVLELVKAGQETSQVAWKEERHRNEAVTNVLDLEQVWMKELEDDLGSKIEKQCAVIAWEERGANEDLMKELRVERARRRELEDVLVLMRAGQDATRVAWEEERHTKEAVIKDLELEQAKRQELEEALELLRAEQKGMCVALVAESEAKDATMTDHETQKRKVEDVLKWMRAELEVEQNQNRELQGILKLLRAEQQHALMTSDEERAGKVPGMQDLEMVQGCMELGFARAGHEGEVKAMQAQVEYMMQALEELELVRTEHESNVNTMKEQREVLMQELDGLQGWCRKLEQDLHSVRAEHQSKVKAMQKQRDLMQDSEVAWDEHMELGQDLRSVRAEHEGKLKTIAEQMESLMQELEMMLGQGTELKHEQLASVKSKHECKLKATKEQLEALMQDLRHVNVQSWELEHRLSSVKSEKELSATDERYLVRHGLEVVESQIKELGMKLASARSLFTKGKEHAIRDEDELLTLAQERDSLEARPLPLMSTTSRLSELPVQVDKKTSQ